MSTPHRPRSAVVDLGSNSVRLVVFEGTGPLPVPIFNEKAVLRLGRGLQDTGRLNEAALDDAVAVMQRYAAIAGAMGATPFEVLATAAIRDASNGAAFTERLRRLLPDVPIRILSGEQEAAFSAAGLVCAVPDANGVLADIGGGSLELVRLHGGAAGVGRTLKLGLIRLADRAAQALDRARGIVERDLAEVEWLPAMAGQDLFLVGGAWRALARMHIVSTGYPINIVDRYTLTREAARAFTGDILRGPKLPGAPRRRVEDVPWAAVVLRRLLRATGVARVVFSASGLREGWYMRHAAALARPVDPLLTACAEFERRYTRNVGMPRALLDWTLPLFPGETEAAARLRQAVCLVSDIGRGDHPEYRAEQAFLRVLRQPGAGIAHEERAFLAVALAVRYEAEPDAGFVAPVARLLSGQARQRAVVLGAALRLAYTLSAGTPDLLAGTRLEVGDRIALRLRPGSGVFAGDSVTRRLERLGAVSFLAVEARETVAA